MIKLIVSDLDGTLIHNHTTIKDEDVEALKRAADLGIGIAVASGRMYPEIGAIMERIGLTGTHAISQNGAYVHMAGGQLVAKHAFAPELLLKLVAAAVPSNFTMMFSAPDHYIAERTTDHIEQLRGRLFAPLEIVPDVKERLGLDIVCGKVSLFGEVDELKIYKHRLTEEFGSVIDAYISDIDCMDIMPSGVSKGTGLHALLGGLSVTPEEAICIGDSFNDISLFAEIPASFAMAGSHADVRARAARTTSGVAEAIAWALERR
jgi:Cof subfamily protein (haloacid dehalogenase superfamily)